MCEQAERVGVALEVGDVVPELVAHFFLYFYSWSFGEECLHCFFSAVSEGRISEVVGQARSRYYCSYFLE